MPDLWEYGLQGPSRVLTERLADASSAPQGADDGDASSAPQGADDGEPVVYSCLQGQESDWHRPPGAREPESTAVHSVIPISAVSHEMAGTQDPGLRTRDPGIVRYGCAGRFPGNPGLGRPRGLAETRDPGLGTLEAKYPGPGTQDPGFRAWVWEPGIRPAHQGWPGPGSRCLACSARHPGPGTQDPGFRAWVLDTGIPGQPCRPAGTRDSGPGTLCQAPGTQDPGPGLSGLGPGTQYSVSSCELPETRDSVSQPGLAGTRGQACKARHPGPRTRAFGPGSRDPALDRLSGACRDSGLGARHAVPGTRDPGRRTHSIVYEFWNS